MGIEIKKAVTLAGRVTALLLSFSRNFLCLEVLSFELEEALRMLADGANLGSLRTNNDVSAVAANPDGITVAAEDESILDVLQQLAIALLVSLLDGSDSAELVGDLCEAFLLSFLSHVGVHVSPLVVLAVSGSLEVLACALEIAAFKILEPQLSVLLLVLSGLLEDSSDLLVAILASFACEISILVASLALTCECFLQVLPCLCSFLILHNVLYLMFLYLLMSCIICSCISVEDTKK